MSFQLRKPSGGKYRSCRTLQTGGWKNGPAFKLFVNGDSEEPGAHLGIEKGVLLETVIPEFFAALGKRIAAADSTFDVWYPTHAEEFDTLAAEYAEKTQ